MGYGAVVFRNQKHFVGHPLWSQFKVDPITAEVFTENVEIGDNAMGERIAAHEALGNVATVAYLREKLPLLMPLAGTALWDCVLNGDLVPRSRLQDLKCEVERLHDVCGDENDVAITDFLNSLGRLIAAAEEEQNPIVIV